MWQKGDRDDDKAHKREIAKHNDQGSGLLVQTAWVQISASL